MIRPIARIAGVVGVALASLAVAPAAALAHGDVRLADGEVTLVPGAAARFEGNLHYHRLVATVDADGPVTVRLLRTATGQAVVEHGSARSLRLNRLVRCCDDAAWTGHTLIVGNPGDVAVTARVRARLVHDDLAVMVDGAESGTRASIVVFGLVWAALLWRATRRRPHDVGLAQPLAILVGASAAVLGVTGYGALQYGTGGAPGLVAGFGDLPILPINPLASRASVAMFVAMILWGVAGLRWVRVQGPPSAAWRGTGIALIGVVAVVAAAVAMSYGHAGVAIASAAAAALPVLAALTDPRRRSIPAGATGAERR